MGTCVEVRGKLVRVHSVSYPVGSGVRTQVISLDSKGLGPLSHLLGPVYEVLRGLGSNWRE